MTAVAVRAAREGDEEGIERLLGTARHEIGRLRGGREAALGDLSGSEAVFVALLGGEAVEALVGLIALYLRGDTAVIEAIYVAPTCREVGVGAELLAAGLRWAQEEGCARIDAVALPGARATKNFYETHGLTARAIIVQREL